MADKAAAKSDPKDKGTDDPKPDPKGAALDPAPDAAPPRPVSGRPPRISLAKGARHLPPARLGQPYAVKLESDVKDAVFVGGHLAGGLTISRDGTIGGTVNTLGPHRFEVCAVSPTRGKSWATFVVAATPSVQGEARVATANGMTADQVQAIIRNALADNEASVQARIDAAVKDAVAKGKAPA